MFCLYLIHLLLTYIQAINISEHGAHHTTEPTIITTQKEIFHDEDTGVNTDNLEFISSWPLQNVDSTKKVPTFFFQKFHPQDIIRPVQEKLKEIHDLLTLPLHPNYGGLILSSPQYLWSKLKEKGNLIFGGAQNSVFGIAHPPSEYPFPYRQVENLKQKFT
ncbi:uncharacterized protein LOC123672566 isoform X2 [Harmonia axyridis]|uniref:uncharacterized protein LOC123672566 isoform X2 n=1 Tax=Harmonia axyridis TaxID=115357 RepID=UPI001E276E6B|nr:uncharacterized protein LOC123672566 isoform X2 [Harmonia axyridis]